MSHERDYRDYKRRALSASVDGRGINISASSSPGTLLHSATSSRAANEWDAVWLYVVNTSGTAVRLTVEWGGTSAPDDHIEVTIPPESGLTEVIAGLVVQNGAPVRAFAATPSVLVGHGFVSRYERT